MEEYLIEDVLTLKCYKCKCEKPLRAFHRDKDSPCGRSKQCKCCVKNYHDEYNKKNKEAISDRRKLRYKNNPAQRQNAISRQIMYYSNPEKRKKLLTKATVYVRERSRRDIDYRLTRNCRTRINNAINGYAKAATTFDMIGCDKYQLKTYIESKWLPDMTWENYGTYKRNGAMKWHIDHIIPCSNFDMANYEQQRKCFHYTNLQPLWGLDNIRKAAKMPEDLK